MSGRLEELHRACIHCGLCLDHCPTYRVTGDEAESPRGRIVLMAPLLGVQDGPVDRAALDHCLGCRGCETACPSGVQYGALLEAARERLGPEPGATARPLAWAVDQLLSRPRWLHAATRAGQLLRRLLPRAWRRRGPLATLDALPARPAQDPRALGLPATGDVAILAGCAQPVFEPATLRATAELVRAAGGQPFVPPGAGCCGALSAHQGSAGRARELARALVDHMEVADALVVPSAGCSAHLAHYGDLLADDPAYAERAAALASRTQDLLTWLAARAERLEFDPDPRRVAYHPPCHHTHAQGIRGVAEALLGRVPRLERVAIPLAERCCGSAGSYSLQQPALARAVRSEKLDDIAQASPELLVTANPGCLFFLEAGLQERGEELPALSLAEYLAGQLAGRGSKGAKQASPGG